MGKNVFIIIIVSLLIFAASFSFFTLDEAGHQEVSMDYELEIDMNQSQSYSIRVPMPSRVDSIEIIEGEGDHTTCETDHGKALCIESDSDMILEAEYYEEGNELWDDIHTRGTENPYRLTLEGESENFWMFSESNNSVDIDLTYTKKVDDPYIAYSVEENLSHSLSDGWNEYSSNSPPSTHGDKFGINYYRAIDNVLIVNGVIAIVIVLVTYYYFKKNEHHG